MRMKISQQAQEDNTALDIAQAQARQQKAAEAEAAKALAIEEAAAEEEAEAEGDPLPPVPLHVFCDALRVALQEIAVAKNVSVELPVASLLALAAACLGRARGVRYRSDWVEVGLNLYLIVICNSGGGKSHVQSFMFQYLDQLEAQCKRRHEEEWEIYRNEMAVWKKSKDSTNKPAPQKPKNVQYMVDDATIESIAERLKDNPRGMLWIQDEMAGFFDDLDRYVKGGGNGKKRLLQSFNSRKWSYNRRTKDGEVQECFLPSATMSIFGGIQKRMVPFLFTPNDVNQGVVQRFLYLYAEVKKMRKDSPEISSQTNDLLRQITERLTALGMFWDGQSAHTPEEDILHLSPAARSVFGSYIELCVEKTFDSPLYPFTVKMFNYVLRLSGIMHCLDWAVTGGRLTDEIDSDTMERTLELVDWLFEHTVRIQPLLPSGLPDEKRMPDPVSADQNQMRIDTLLKFISDNKEFATEEHTLDEAFGKGLPREPWAGKNDAGTAAIFAKWAKTAGKLTARASGKKWWIFANFTPAVKTGHFLGNPDAFEEPNNESTEIPQ